jgi:MFS family permease
MINHAYLRGGGDMGKTLSVANIQTSLTREQKEAVGLLSIGTFLEYFDLMLYVHMAVLLNELFFPKTDPFTSSLLTAFAFCSTYVLRPIGALIFGYIGDNIGRKFVVIITTAMMGISCFVMSIAPTYAQIGIGASYLVTICRIIQGLSSLGEVVGAEIYLTEFIKPPTRYAAVAFVGSCCALGGTAALGLAFLVTSFNLDWRIGFQFGVVIAAISVFARFRLHETPEFVDAKRRLANIVNMIDRNKKESIIIPFQIQKEKVNPITSFSYFLIQSAWPVIFYFGYIHCSIILKNSLNFSSSMVIYHNFIVSIFQFLGLMVLVYSALKIDPLKLVKVKILILSVMFLFFPYFLENTKSSTVIFFIQLSSLLLVSDLPSTGIYFKHFPVFKRFTYTSLLYSLSRTIVPIITSIGSVFIVRKYGEYGMLIIVMPIFLGYLFGVNHFQVLEQKTNNYLPL